MVLLVIASWHMNFATSWQMIVASTLDFHDPLPAHCNIWLGVCCVCVLRLQECAMYVGGTRAATESGSMSCWHNLPTSVPEKSRTLLAKVL